MILILLSVVSGLSLPGVLADSNSDNKLQNFLYNRCRSYSTDAIAYDNIRNDLTNFISYAEFTMNLLPNGKAQFCEVEKDRLLQSLRRVTSNMRPCFPREERYLPNFLLESFEGFLNFLCVHHGRNIVNFFSTQGADCRTALSQGQASDEIANCFNKIFPPIKGFVAKSELCDDLSIAKKCFSVTLTKHCPNFPSFDILNKDFFEAISKPCGSATSTYVSVTLLTLAFLVSKVFS